MIAGIQVSFAQVMKLLTPPTLPPCRLLFLLQLSLLLYFSSPLSRSFSLNFSRLVSTPSPPLHHLWSTAAHTCPHHYVQMENENTMLYQKCSGDGTLCTASHARHHMITNPLSPPAPKINTVRVDSIFQQGVHRGQIIR